MYCLSLENLMPCAISWASRDETRVSFAMIAINSARLESLQQSAVNEIFLTAS